MPQFSAFGNFRTFNHGIGSCVCLKYKAFDNKVVLWQNIIRKISGDIGKHSQMAIITLSTHPDEEKNKLGISAILDFIQYFLWICLIFPKISAILDFF